MLLVVFYSFELRHWPRSALTFELEFLMIDHSDVIFLFVEAVDLHLCELVLNQLFSVLGHIPVTSEYICKNVHRLLLGCFFHTDLFLCDFLREVLENRFEDFRGDLIPDVRSLIMNDILV